MDTYYAHIILELIAQEYIVVAADYRGSTGSVSYTHLHATQRCYTEGGIDKTPFRH